MYIHRYITAVHHSDGARLAAPERVFPALYCDVLRQGVRVALFQLRQFAVHDRARSVDRVGRRNGLLHVLPVLQRGHSGRDSLLRLARAPLRHQDSAEDGRALRHRRELAVFRPEHHLLPGRFARSGALLLAPSSSLRRRVELLRVRYYYTPDACPCSPPVPYRVTCLHLRAPHARRRTRWRWRSRTPRPAHSVARGRGIKAPSLGPTSCSTGSPSTGTDPTAARDGRRGGGGGRREDVASGGGHIVRLTFGMGMSAQKRASSVFRVLSPRPSPADRRHVRRRGPPE